MTLNIFMKTTKNIESFEERKSTSFKNTINLVKNEINRNNDEDKNDIINENIEDNDEKDGERIKKLITGNQKAINENINNMLNQLLMKLKLNAEIIRPDKALLKFKNVNGDFFFRSWVKSFDNEDFKSHKEFKKYFDVNNMKSLNNFKIYIKELLPAFQINFYIDDPHRLEAIIPKKQ